MLVTVRILFQLSMTTVLNRAACSRLQASALTRSCSHAKGPVCTVCAHTPSKPASLSTSLPPPFTSTYQEGEKERKDWERVNETDTIVSKAPLSSETWGALDGSKASLQPSHARAGVGDLNNNRNFH